MVPGMGDEHQAIKAGIIEIGDLFVINKCERRVLTRWSGSPMVSRRTRTRGTLEPLIFKTEAILGKGIVELTLGIYRHKQVFGTE